MAAQSFTDSRGYINHYWQKWVEAGRVQDDIKTIEPKEVIFYHPKLKPGQWLLIFLVNTESVWVVVKYREKEFWVSEAGLGHV